jgi:UDP-N-acetylglucosamine 2-epimerase (non-hydrolysing)
MKAKPVLDALERRDVDAALVHTGQHYDAAMSEVFFSDLELRRPDYFLGVGSGTHAEQTAGIMLALEPLLAELEPQVVLVFGDVNSTVAAALVAAKAGVLLGHVEAGLRSRDWRMPEEINRVATDRLSDYLFAPSDDAAANLRAEGYRADQIHMVGNVMVDSLLEGLERVPNPGAIEELGLRDREYGVLTLHRPENVDDLPTLTALLETLERVATKLPLVLPAHPRLSSQLRNVEISTNIVVTKPLGYLDFLSVESRARLVLTDSGGIQEETTILGIPCLTLRETTERPITVSEGTNVVVGRDPDRILSEVQRALAGEFQPRRPRLWDGRAGERIAEVLINDTSSSGRPRPTELA